MSENLTYRILRLLSQLETSGAPVSSAYLARVLSEEYRATYEACQMGVYDGLVWFDRCGYRLTSEGAESLSEVRTADYLYASEEREFKKEVLTGFDQKGEKSKIDSGVLPTRERHHARSQQDYQVETMRKLSKIGITSSNIDSVRICRQCYQLYLIDMGCCENEETK